eukprot:688493-Karenia_brevis.AAC.1
MGQGQRPCGSHTDAPDGYGMGIQWYQGQLKLKDHMGDVWQPNPQYGMGLLRLMLEEARVQLLWKKAAEHRHGG